VTSSSREGFGLQDPSDSQQYIDDFTFFSVRIDLMAVYIADNIHGAFSELEK